jgi:hypothetical protein
MGDPEEGSSDWQLATPPSVNPAITVALQEQSFVND